VPAVELDLAGEIKEFLGDRLEKAINEAPKGEKNLGATEILKDELNIKNIEFISGEEQKVELDIYITEVLKQEGNYRELIRAVQDMRKKAGLNPNDVISLNISVGVEGQEIINKFKTDLLKSVGAKNLEIKENEGVEVKIDEIIFKIITDILNTLALKCSVQLVKLKKQAGFYKCMTIASPTAPSVAERLIL